MVEMKEIKPNLLTRLKGFFLLHPVAVAIIAVVFAIMLFGGCEKARAESLDQYYLDTLRPMFPNFTDAQWDVVDTAAQTCPYFIKLDCTNGARVLILYPFSSQYVYDHSTGMGNTDPCFCPAGSSNYIGTEGFLLSPYSLGNITGNVAYTYYIFTDMLVYPEVHGFKYVPSRQLYDDRSSWNMRWFSCSTSYIVGGSTQQPSWTYIHDSYLTNDNCVFETNYTAFTKFEKNIEKPTYVDDDRLKFAIIDNTSNGKTLMTDIRDFIADFPIHDTSHSSVYLNPDSIVLGYSVDGVSKTITLDSNNSSIRSKYIFETPLSVFDYSDSDDVVSITTCEFTIVGAAQGDPDLTTQTYMISCDYPIKRVANPIDKGNNQYSNDVNGDITSPEVTRTLNYLITFREGYGLDFDKFSDIKFPDYYTYADVYLYNNQAAYNYLMNNLFNPNSVAYIIQNIANDEDDVITQIGLFLDDSNYGQYYDVIVFDWIQESSSSITHTYYYFETVSGRNKASTQIVRILQEDVNNIKVNSAAIFTAVDNLEDESLQFFNAKLAIDEDILAWLRTIDYSINGINIPEPDYSVITSRLNYIMDKLSIIANHSSLPSEDDTVSEAIAYFKSHSLNDLPIQSVFDDNKLSIWMAGKVHSWLQGTDSQTTKTSLLNDAFETLTNLYDSLTNEADFFGNMEKYLLSLRGGGIQDRDGLYFSRFFQNSFDPDSYDGGSL